MVANLCDHFFSPNQPKHHRSLSGAFDQAKRRLNAESKGGPTPWPALIKEPRTKNYEPQKKLSLIN